MMMLTMIIIMMRVMSFKKPRRRLQVQKTKSKVQGTVTVTATLTRLARIRLARINKQQLQDLMLPSKGLRRSNSKREPIKSSKLQTARA